MCVYFAEVCDKLFELGFVGVKVKTVYNVPYFSDYHLVREEYEFRHNLLNFPTPTQSWLESSMGFKLLISTERDAFEDVHFNHSGFCADGSRVTLVEYNLGYDYITEYFTEGISKALDFLFDTTHELVLKDKLEKI